MFSKILFRLTIPLTISTLLVIGILAIVTPVATQDTLINAEDDKFIYLPIIQKPPPPPGPNWSKVYSDSDDKEIRFGNFAQFSGSNYVVIGSTKNLYYTSFIIAVDGEGNILWQTGIEGKATTTGLSDVTVTGDNHILAVGDNSGNMFVVKLSADGNVIWANLYGDEDLYLLGKSVSGRAILELQDGNYIAIGNTSAYGNGSDDAFIIKLNPDGSINWQKTVGGAQSDSVHAATMTSHNTVLVIGETTDATSFDSTPWIFEISSDGNILWQTVIPDSDCDFNSIIELKDGNFLAAGRAGGEIPGCLLKLKDDGTPIWQKIIGNANYGEFRGVAETSEGTILASGYKMKPGTTINDGWLVAFDTGGNKLWEKTYGDQDANLFTDIQVLYSGQLVTLGYVYSFSQDQSMGWLSKFEPDGSLDNCDLISTSFSIVTDTMTTASPISLGTTIPTSTLTATHTLNNISIISNQLCYAENNLSTCD